MRFPTFLVRAVSRARRLAGGFVGLGLAPAAVFAAAGEPASPAVSAREFAPRSGPRGATLFTALPSAQTGLAAPNPYDDPTMWAERYREFSLGAIGTGLAAGDYDGDGRPDLFIVTKTKGCCLFRNLGGCRFEDVTARAGVAGPGDAWQQGVAAVDFDGDGDLDFYVCRFDAPNLLFVNQGDGTFREEAAARGLALRDASSMAAFADYDRDGDLDVYLQTNVLDAERRPNGQRDRLYRNHGDGTFTDVTDDARVAGETQGHSATWWDFDEDGWPDLYVANDFKDPDTLYRNNRDGTFTNVLSQVVPHTPHSSMGADCGDVDNDGRLDLLVADMAATTRAKDHRGMAKVRAGLTDDEQRPHAAPQYMRNALLLNGGGGVMREAACHAGLDATDWTWSVRLEDLDEDGRLDAHFTNGMVRELHNADLVERMMTRESFAERTRLMRESPVLAERHLAFRNVGGLRFEDVSAAWGLDRTGVGFGAVFADFDGDGDLDLVVANLDGEPSFHRNDNDRGHRVIVALRGAGANRWGVGAVLRATVGGATQTRALLLARGYLSTSEPVLHFGLGEAAAIERLEIRWPGGRTQVLEHLPADRRYTITEPATDAGPAAGFAAEANGAKHTPRFVRADEARGLAVTVRERPASARARQPALPFRFGRPGPGAALADLDGDGEDELVVGGAEGEKAQLLGNLGDGHFLPQLVPVTPNVTADAAPLFLDADGDGRADLLLARGGDARPAGDAAYRPALLLNDGTGRLRAAAADAVPAFASSTGPVVAADFDRDGRLDVFLGARLVPGRYPETPASALWLNRGGKFEDVTDAFAPALRRPGLVAAALASDVDGDGWIDLVLALDWGAVRVFRNDAGKSFTDTTDVLGFAAAGPGCWTSLQAGDFNGDGRLDYVAGNLGTNTVYRAAPAQPLELLAGDLDGTGRFGVLEVLTENGVRFPRRGLPQFAAAFPALGRKFTSFDAFATTPLAQLLAPDRLAAATRLVATELRSGVFLSRTDGTFAFAPLPVEAQLAPLNGAVAADFDGDGALDLVFVQNSYAPLAEVGRFADGIGAWLRGDGRGNFTAVAAGESGFVVRHDAKALVATDLDRDGWPDLIATRGNETAVAFTTAAAAGRRSVEVRLRGPAGNPTAIGARLEVAFADGRTRVAEIAAGGGHRSQSSAAAWIAFPADAPPREVAVRWPDGRRSVHPWSPSGARLLVVAPVSPAP